MATSFPGSLDSFVNPSGSDALDSVSVPHATQHADLNDAVEALEAKVGVDGSAVTTSLDYKVAQQGLVLIKTQAIGSAVSSVTVSDAFSADYDNYKIIISIDNSSVSFAELKLSLGGITFNYYSGGLEVFWGSFSSFTNHFAEGPEANFKIGYQDSGATVCIVELQNPFSSTSRTSISALQSPQTGSLTMMGFVDSIASATSVIISPDSGTISGGTIRVYGYNNG